jgi:outer membrane protein TolC
LAAIEGRASEFRRRVRNAQIMLTRWTGTASDAPLAGKPAIDAIRLDPATLDTALSHHPEIAVLNKQVDIAEADARLAQADKQADWSVEVAFQQRGPAYSNMVSIGVSLPLQWDQKHRQDRELSSKLAMVEQSKAERDEMLREHVAETRVMIEEWQNGRERGARYEQELIPLANQRIDAVLTAYRGGKASLIDLLAARRNAIDTRLQARQLQADTARLWAQLNFLFPINDEMHMDMPMNKDSQ